MDVIKRRAGPHEAQSKFNPNNDIISLKHSWGMINEWMTSNTASVLYLSKLVLRNVGPMVQDFKTCTELLDSTSLTFENSKKLYVSYWMFFSGLSGYRYLPAFK